MSLKCPSIIIAYLFMLRLDCVIEVTRWGILRIEFYLLYFYYVDFFSVCLVGIASKLYSLVAEVWIVYVLMLLLLGSQ
jgi:hypothetical protein